MKLVLLVALLSLALSCGVAEGPNPVNRSELGNRNVGVWHDDQRGVTCWIYAGGYAGEHGGGISCLPDAQLKK